MYKADTEHTSREYLLMTKVACLPKKIQSYTNFLYKEIKKYLLLDWVIENIEGVIMKNINTINVLHCNTFSFQLILI